MSHPDYVEMDAWKSGMKETVDFREKEAVQS